MIAKVFVRFALPAGILAGLACFAFFYMLKINDAMPLGTRRNLGMVFVWIAMAAAAYRYWKASGRSVHFLEAFLLCLAVMLVASVVDGLLVSAYVKYAEPGLIPEYIAQLKVLALRDQAAIQKEFGNKESSGLIDFETFLKQIDQISPESIFWSTFGIFRMIFHVLYAALIGVWVRKMSL